MNLTYDVQFDPMTAQYETIDPDGLVIALSDTERQAWREARQSAELDRMTALSVALDLSLEA